MLTFHFDSVRLYLASSLPAQRVALRTENLFVLHYAMVHTVAMHTESYADYTAVHSVSLQGYSI
jgi:hypothetical protein